MNCSKRSDAALSHVNIHWARTISWARTVPWTRCGRTALASLGLPTLGLLALAAGCSPDSAPLPEVGASAQALHSGIELNPIGTYAAYAGFDESAQEIVAYDAASQRLFVANVSQQRVDAIDISNPAFPILSFSIDVTPFGAQANSVAVHRGTVAVAIEAEDAQASGILAFFNAAGEFQSQVTVGAMPDMVTFTPNGRYALVANEGEPNDDYTVDPEGSVSIVNMRGGAARLTDAAVRTASFTGFDQEELDSSVRIYGPGASVAQDLEPEYIAVDQRSRTAWVTLQENNAIAIIDIRSAQVTDIVGLGFKDHSLADNGFDASNKDDAIAIAPHPVKGMYQPDAIAAFRSFGRQYLIVANEGDARDYDGYSEEDRVKDLDLDPTAFPDADALQDSENLGRLKITTAHGDTDGDGDFDEIYSYGARSFSILDRRGNLIFDSGDELERITAGTLPEHFNSTDDDNDSFDSRSDDKGPEPEGVVTGRIGGQTYAFIGLERVGGIVVYNVSRPWAPSFVQYINTRNFEAEADEGAGGDLAPEGMVFISAADSPTRKPLLVVSFEISGTTTIFEISSTGWEWPRGNSASR